MKTIVTAKLHCKRKGKTVAVSGGVPFAPGVLKPEDRLVLTQGQLVCPVDAKTLASWPDGSVKWSTISSALLEGFDIDAEVSLTHVSQSDLAKGDPLAQSDTSLLLNNDGLRAESSKLVIERKAGSARLLDRVGFSNNQAAGVEVEISAVGVSGPLSAKVIEIKECEASTEQRRIIMLDGQFYTNSDQASLKFRCKLEVPLSGRSIFGAFEVHNPNAAEHPEGIWDLGDPGSVFLKDLCLRIRFQEASSLNYRVEDDQPWQQYLPEGEQSLEIAQASSGKQNWQSPNHVDRSGNVSLPYCGYRVSSGAELIQEGKHAQPWVSAVTNGMRINAHLEDFWQNFPSAVRLSNHAIVLGLFPDGMDSELELQGGEKKTQRFVLQFDDASSELPSDKHEIASFQLDQSYWQQVGVLPYFAPESAYSPLKGLIQNGLDGDCNFFVKRDQIDEYGWRNFGDIYADHELLEFDGDSIISHYNNQYDPLYGFLRQYLATGDVRWWELADDLAKHILDIDLYDTDHDRAEYNHGLFWHTDHYVDASTSTHRTYSKDQAGQHSFAGLGGGPAGQHCYTAGLSYYYFLTGDPKVKQSILSMTQWITHYYEGAGTCLDLLLAFKNRDIVDFKHPFSTGHAYPLDRGVGHYLNAMMDAYSMTGDHDYLKRVEAVIRGTVHPKDPLEQRDLLNADYFWFYTVFYQAVSRFLGEKEELGEIDSAFEYARACLIHYASWMVENEAPYLDNPGILEFPNHTWVAQDLRKSVVLYQAFRFSAGHDRRFLDKARFFRDYVAEELASHETKSFSRILAILMQNQGVDAFIDENVQWRDYGEVKASFGDSPMVKPKPAFKVIVAECLKTLSRLNPKRELQWLRVLWSFSSARR